VTMESYYNRLEQARLAKIMRAARRLWILECAEPRMGESVRARLERLGVTKHTLKKWRRLYHSKPHYMENFAALIY
jgi:hypothetical protein